MKRILLLLVTAVLSLPVFGREGSFLKDGQVYKAVGLVDLGGGTITLEEDTVVDLTSGTLRNGVLVGHHSSLAVKGDDEVLDNVSLKGTWKGKVCDLWFRQQGNSPYWILSSIMKFNEVRIEREEYWMDLWYPITLNGESMVVYGNGVKIFLPTEKGETISTSWGQRYRKECLFCQPPDGNLSRGAYTFKDIEIEDNEDAVGVEGWGQKMDLFRIYYYFEVIGRDLVFDHVSSDGGGILVKVYNYWQDIDHIWMEGCSVRAMQFAVEIGNFPRQGFPGGSCKELVIRDCSFYQYPVQPYVGLLSVVGETLTESILIENSEFDAAERDGNLELSSGKHIILRGNRMTNQFLNSYSFPSIERYEATDNTFIFRKHVGNESFKFGGKEVVFKGNRLLFMTDDIGFITIVPGIRSLSISDNIFDFSHVESMTSSRTVLSLPRPLILEGNIELVRNRVVDPSYSGGHKFIFRLPAGTNIGNNRFKGIEIK